MAKTDKDQSTQETTTEGPLLAGRFKTPEELAEAFMALEAEKEAAQQSFESEKDKAVDAVIKQFQEAHRKSLGTLTPNTIPGVNRKPVKTAMPGGITRVDY